MEYVLGHGWNPYSKINEPRVIGFSAKQFVKRRNFKKIKKSEIKDFVEKMVKDDQKYFLNWDGTFNLKRITEVINLVCDSKE